MACPAEPAPYSHHILAVSAVPYILVWCCAALLRCRCSDVFLQAVLKEVSDSNGKIVLFIDEIHTVVGAGATGGAMDAGERGVAPG